MGQAPSGSDKEVTLQHIQALYRRFASECPSGNLHLHEFKKIFRVNNEFSEEESAYMENVFRSFDTNKVMSYIACSHVIDTVNIICFQEHNYNDLSTLDSEMLHFVCPRWNMQYDTWDYVVRVFLFYFIFFRMES